MNFRPVHPQQPMTAWDMASPYWRSLPRIVLTRDAWLALPLDANSNSFREIGHQSYVCFQDGDSIVGGLYLNMAVGQSEFDRYRIAWAGVDGQEHEAIVLNAKEFRSELYKLPHGTRGYAMAADIRPDCLGPREAEDSNARYDQIEESSPAALPRGHGTLRKRA